MAHNWVRSTNNKSLPEYAILGGKDVDGSPIYVGRAMHEGENLPAKVVPSNGCAYVSYFGKEHVKTNYEVLAGHGYDWKGSSGGNVPENAVTTGKTGSGEPLYVGRGHHANSLIPGKVHPSQGCLFLPFGGQEVRIDNYEVLVRV